MAGGEQKGLLNSCPDCGDVVDVSNFGPYEKIACPSCGSAMRVRTHFNHFAIERKLGEGGMSEVFQARDLTLNRSVALKVLHRELTTDAELTKRFETEARLTASISHPNVVKVYSVGEDQGYYYIAMEVVEGRNLEELISEGGKLSEDRVWEIGIQVAQGLRAAHQTGLIHRDIKPGNILLARGQEAKIVDFGLALVAGRDVDESKVIWATPFYVPPEKLHDQPEDVRSDIYSLGATLFHALAGRPPFDADTQSLEALRKIKDRSVSLADAAPEVSEKSCRLIDRMLARNPADRFEDYDELLREMNAARTIGERDRRPEPYSQRALGFATAAFFLIALVIIYRSHKAKVSEDDIAKAVDVEVPVTKLIVEDSGMSASEGAAKFVEARDLLLAGKSAKARTGFEELIGAGQLSWPTSEWAILNAGLGALLDGEAAAARELFGKLGEEEAASGEVEDEDLSEFFKDVGARMRRTLPVMIQEHDPGQSSTIHAMAWLAYGLKNWQDGRFEEAVVYFEAFKEADPPQRVEWINSYKVLLEPFEKDIELITRIPRPKSSMNLAEVEDMLDTFGKFEGRLRVKGSGVKLFEERHARARKLQEGLVEELKSMERTRIAAQKEAAQRVRGEEMTQFDKILESVDRLGKLGAFGDAVSLLAAAEFKTEPAKAAAQDQLRIFRSANSFIPRLVEDLNEYGYSGEIGLIGLPPLKGAIAKASATEIRVRRDLGEAFGETTLPFSSLSQTGLLRIAQSIAQEMAPGSEQTKRREMAVFYARLTGLDNYAQSAGEALASEDEEFAKFWERIPAPAAAAAEAAGSAEENPS